MKKFNKNLFLIIILFSSFIFLVPNFIKYSLSDDLEKEDYKSKEEFGAIELVETIKEHTKLLDLNRGQHTKKYIPELEEFIYG